MAGQEIFMRLAAKFATVALVCAGPALAMGQQAKTAAAQPLTAMPYSPSLAVTSMDKTVDPCNDFYKYSCGGWLKNNPIPADQSRWDVYAKLATDNLQFLWGILEADAKASNRDAVQQKVGDYFESCMNTAAIDAKGIAPLQPVLAEVNAYETRAALIAALPALDRDHFGTFFINAGTEQDAMAADVIIVGLNTGGLGLPDRDYYLKTDPKTVKIREQYVAFLEKLMGLAGESSADAKADAAAAMTIETALAKASLTRVERRDPHKIYHMLTMAELHELAPSVDWPRFFEIEGGAHPAKLNVSQPEFVKAVEHELTTEPLPVLKGYLRVRLASGAAPYLAHPVEQASWDFYSHTLRGTPEMPPRWKTCTRTVDRNLGEALGQEFVRRTFSADTKAKTQLMTEQIEAAMKSEIEALPWMSPATKEEALRKLHAIRNKIGYPDKWRDYTALDVKRDDYFGDARRANTFATEREWHKLGKPVDLNEWGMTPPTVNAYFNPSMNDINFPAGVLQPPLYDPKMDDAPNYGNTGGTIGHELTHAFDDEGRQFDDKGNLRNWWTPEDAKGFETRIQCIRDQYAGYVVVDDVHINSKLTSGEDVADLGGELLAYIAWQKQLAIEKAAGQHVGPPADAQGNIEGLTPDQRFFVGMAQWACEAARPEELRANAITDPHSPGFARINGVVSNMPEFAKAFGCKAGQPMVHTPSCRVW
jgi:endothelin-converting enzyme/putative endopeptidase